MVTVAIDTRIVSKIIDNYSTSDPKDAYDRFWRNTIKKALDRNKNIQIIIISSMVKEHASKLRTHKDCVEQNITRFARRTKFSKVRIITKSTSEINSYKKRLEYKRKGIVRMLKKALREDVDVDIAVLALNGILDKVHTTDKKLGWIIETHSGGQVRVNIHPVNQLTDVDILFEDDP